MNPTPAKSSPESAGRRPAPPVDVATPLFRPEAVRARERGDDTGDVLKISPRWTDPVFKILLVLMAAVLLFMIFGRVPQHATGAAIVRIENRVEVTALRPGTVESIAAVPGERVAAGQVLVRFHAEAERSELARMQREFDLELVRLLQDLDDAAARAALARLRAEIGLANSRLEERVVHAPHSGLVQDVRIRPGQLLAAGDPILALAGEDRRQHVVALVPGAARPLLRPGMPLRFELRGPLRVALDLEIDRIGDEAIGPAAVRHFLGPAVGDAVDVGGPVVVVTAVLPRATFEVDGREHSFFDGMQGVAEIRVHDEPILIALVPGLRALQERLR